MTCQSQFSFYKSKKWKIAIVTAQLTLSADFGINRDFSGRCTFVCQWVNGRHHAAALPRGLESWAIVQFVQHYPPPCLVLEREETAGNHCDGGCYNTLNDGRIEVQHKTP